MMTLRNRAARVAWPRRWCLAVAGLMALAHLSGCSHNRQTSYRPIFARPTSGCSTCGGSSGTVTTEGAVGVPTTTVPALSAPASDSAVTPSTSIRGGSGDVRSSTVERPPTAQPVEPEWDAYSPTQRNSAKPPSTPPQPASPGAGSEAPGPELEAREAPRPPGTRMTPTPGPPAGPHPATSPRRAPGWRLGSSRTSPARAPTSSSIPTRPTAPGVTSSCITAPRPRAITTRSTASTASSWATTAAAITSSSATATAAATARSRSPSAGTIRSRASIAATPALTRSMSTASASAWSAISTSKHRRPGRSPPRRPSWPTSASAIASTPIMSRPMPISRPRPPCAPASSSRRPCWRGRRGGAGFELMAIGI